MEPSSNQPVRDPGDSRGSGPSEDRAADRATPLTGGASFPDRRAAELDFLGFGGEIEGVAAKVDGELLSRMAKSYADWIGANEAPITDIFDERWAGNLAARVTPPGVIALVELRGISDDDAREKLQAALSGDPDSRLYGGMHSSFVARMSPQSLLSVARIDEVFKIS